MDHDGSVVAELNMEIGRSGDRRPDRRRTENRGGFPDATPMRTALTRRRSGIASADARPTLEVSLSSEISPKFREYERTSTTVANAYIKPIVARYISRLETALAARGLDARLFVMQSSGGLISPDIACDYPIRIIESGAGRPGC